jgi:hypothetical protein
MKFLKSTIAMVALFAIASVNAKIMKKQGQSTTQPVKQPVDNTDEINSYIYEILDENYNELEDMLLKDFDNYNEQDICTFINNLAQFVADKFPMDIPTAKQLFKTRIMEFCKPIQNDHTKIAFIQGCIDKSMLMPVTTNVVPSTTTTKMTPQRGNRHRMRQQGQYRKVTPNK